MMIETARFVLIIVKVYNVKRMKNYNIMEGDLCSFLEIIIIKNTVNLSMEKGKYI